MIKLYATGFVGNLGAKILINEKRDELISHFNKEFISHVESQLDETLNEDGVNPSLIMSSYRGEFQKSTDFKVVDVERIEKGGVLSALWKLCDRNKWGLRYSLRKIPILQGTIEIANYFDINPYRLLTHNAFIIACEFVGDKFHEPLSEIGDITNEKKRVRIDGEVEAFLTKDYKDEIDKVLHNYTKIMGLV